MSQRTILCVSFDRMVSDNRCVMLKEAGYDVTATTNVEEALDLLGRERFDAVIVGHRFSEEEKYLLAVEAKEKSYAPVLLVCGASADSQIPATSRVYALEGSAGLLSALSALIPVEPGLGSRAAA
jgi:DNA-binding response OmpR family regulator